MEHKTLNSEQSIAIITRMLQNTQNNLQKNAGSYFLLWGYVTLITSLAVYAALVATGDWRFNYLWFAIPLAGLPLMFIVRRRIGQPPVRTFVDIAVWKLWIPLCVALLTFSFLAGGPGHVARAAATEHRGRPDRPDRQIPGLHRCRGSTAFWPLCPYYLSAGRDRYWCSPFSAPWF